MPTPASHASSRPGTVTARFRRDFRVEDEHGRIYHCLSGRRDLRPVVGDRVTFKPGSVPTDPGHIVAVEARRNCLERIDGRGRSEPMAANLTQLVVVAAVLPVPDLLVLDRYLCAAELIGVPALLVCNKIDLDESQAPGAQLAAYRDIGYPVLAVSAKTGAGVRELQERLQDHCSSLVGQSGVGKSSLLNRLVPEAEQAVGSLSEKSRAGRHTTTTAILHRLPSGDTGGGTVIDSPGVRSYSPPLPEPARVQTGFREIVALASECRFADCLHLEEPGCRVQQALQAQTIGRSRYDSYRRLLELARRFEHPWN